MESTRKIEINWPVKALFNYVSDVDNHGHWRNGIVHATWLDQTKNESGARVLETRYLMGQQVSSILEVTEFKPYQKRSVQIMKGTFRPSYTLEFEPRGDSTVMTLTVRCTHSNPARQDVIVKRISEQGYKELQKLKEILEFEN